MNGIWQWFQDNWLPVFVGAMIGGVGMFTIGRVAGAVAGL